MERCMRFKQKMLRTANQLVEDQKRSVKSTMREAQRAVRALESEIALLHTQNEEAEATIRSQKDNEKEIRQLVEEKFRESIAQLTEHLQALQSKQEAQVEANAGVRKRFEEVQTMFQELKRKRLYADPFVRRRAENLVKGLLRNLNEHDLKEQEELEEQVSGTYHQWKKIVEYCTDMERQLGLMINQEKVVSEEFIAQTVRIERERIEYRDRAKTLKVKDNELSARLKVLEDKLSDKARNERRKLHFEHKAEELKKPMASGAGGGKNNNNSTVPFAGGNNSVSGGGTGSGEGDGGGEFDAEAYLPELEKQHREDSDDSYETVSSESSEGENDNDDESSTTTTGSPGQLNTKQRGGAGKQQKGGKKNSDAPPSRKSNRVKQKGVRGAVAPICDPRTEILLGITHEHTKRQEISRTVHHHVPRPEHANITGSEHSDVTLLGKAQKTLKALHSPAVGGAASTTTGRVGNNKARKGGAAENVNDDAAQKGVLNIDHAAVALATAAEEEQEKEEDKEIEVWATQTNSPSKPSSSVGFRDHPPGSSASQKGRRQSTFSSAKVNYGFWAEPDAIDLDDSSDSDGFLGGGGPGSADRPHRHHRGAEVLSLSTTACYVSLYYRYLKKFPNLNFRRDNPRLNSPVVPPKKTIEYVDLDTIDASFPGAIPGVVNRDRDSDDDEDGGDEEEDGGDGSRNRSGAGTAGAVVNKKDGPSELIGLNNRFQFTIKEGLVVVKEALDSLLHNRCIDKIIVTDALEKMSDLERRVRIFSIPEEEKEVRYQLHYLCVSLIHTILENAPTVLLVRNNRKHFVEVLSCMLALLGVVLNCSLVFWQPNKNKNKLSSKVGGIAPERAEFICAHLIELVITLGEIDTSGASSGKTSGLSGASTVSKKFSVANTSTSSKNFKSKKPADNPVGPAGFIALLRIQTAELLRKEHESSGSRGGAGGGTASGSTASGASSAHPPPSAAFGQALIKSRMLPNGRLAPNASLVLTRPGEVINFHDLFEMFTKIVDEDEPIAATEDESAIFTIKHRHAILSLQLFLFVSLNNREISMDEAVLKLHKGIMDGTKAGRALSGSEDNTAVVPTDVDVLLQQMNPSMVPAILALELMRRVLEAEFTRVEFLKRIVDEEHDVADLQFLNVSTSSKFDVELKKSRGVPGSAASGSGSGASTADGGSALTISAKMSGPAGAVPGDHQNPVTSAALAQSQEAPEQHPLQLSRFRTTKEVHTQWVEDLEVHVKHLCDEIVALIRPVSISVNAAGGGDNTALREPSFLGQRSTVVGGGGGAANSNNKGKDSNAIVGKQQPKAPTIPLPDVLVYKILAHVNTLRTITGAHSINGLARVQATHPMFVQCMRELVAARSKIMAIVTAMTWPMKKKLDWLKLKYNTILEENALANKQVSEFNSTLDKYKRDIETFKSSIVQVDKEKHTMEYRRTKTLLLNVHDPQIRQLIVDHATDEYLHKLTDFKAREERLASTIESFAHEYGHLCAQTDTLKAAQRSLTKIDQEEEDAAKALEAENRRRARKKTNADGTNAAGGGDFDSEDEDEKLLGDITTRKYSTGIVNKNSLPSPVVPEAISGLLNAIDAFVHTKRLSEVLPAEALRDPPLEALSAHKLVARAGKSKSSNRAAGSYNQ